MIGLNAGTAWLAVKPDLRGLHRKIKAEVSGINASVGVDVDPAEVKSKVDAATKKASPTVKAKLDDKQIKRDVERLQREVKSKKLELDADTAEGRKKLAELKAEITRAEAALKLDADDAAAKQKVADLKAQAKQVQSEVDLKTAPARAEYEALRAELSSRKVELDVDVDGANAALRTTQSLADRSSLSFGQMAIAAGTLGTALIPVTATAGALAAALSAPLLAAGGGLTVFGLLAGAAAKQTNEQYKEIEELRKKLAGLEKGTEEYAQAQQSLKSKLSSLTPAQRKYKNALDGVKGTLESMVGGATGNALLGPLASGLDLVRRGMKLSQPIIKGVSGALSDVIDAVARWTRGGEAKGFIDWFSKQAPPAIKTFSTIIGNTAVGVAGLVRAFAPMGTDVIGWIEGVTRKFRDFGRTADKNPALQNFLQYVREVGPQVGQTLGAVARALGKILLAGAPIGTVMLQALEGLANAINAIPTKVLTTFIIALGAYKTAAIAAGIASKALAGRLALLKFGVLAGGIGLLTSNLGSLRKGASTSDQALAGLKNTAGLAAVGFAAGGPWGAAIGGAAGLLGSLAQASYNATDGFRSTYRMALRAADALGGKDKEGGLSTVVRGVSGALKFMSNRVLGNEEASKKMKKSHALATRNVDVLTDSLKRNSGALTKNTKKIILEDFARRGGLRAARMAGINVGVVTKALFGNEKAYFRVSRALNDNTKKTDTQRRAGAKLNRLMNGSIRSTNKAQRREQALGEARRKQKKPLDELSTRTKTLTGRNRDLADAVKGIPANPTIAYKSTGFQSVMDEVNQIVGGLQGMFNLLADARPAGPQPGRSRSGNVPMRANGGPISGPGTSTSDSIPTWLSNNEFVMRAKAVKKYGSGFMHAVNAGRFADGGQPGGRFLPGFGSGGGFRGLWRNEIEPAINRLIRAIRSQGTTSTPSPNTGGTGGGRAFLNGFGGGGRRNFLNGFGFGGGSKKFMDGYKKTQPILEGFTKGLKKNRDATIGMEMAVGKSSKKMGKYWTVLRKGSVKHFSRDWQRTTRNAERDIIKMQRESARQTDRVGKGLIGFRRGPLRGFSKDMGQTFRKDAPGDVSEFRVRTLKHMSSTATGISKTWRSRVRPTMHEFGAYPKRDVAPAFGKGVDAIGGQWDRVRNATGKPVKFVVSTVLNKGLLAAFNKIAKFVDTDTIKKIALPKGFDGGGWTGPGRRMKPAGVVHADEFVVNKPSRRKFERKHPGALDHINRTGEMPDNDRRMRPPRRSRGLPGYWTGGGVFPYPTATSTEVHDLPYHGAWYAADMNGPYDNTSRGKIVAWKDGVVALVKQSSSSYGNETIVNHKDGNYTRYAHQLAQYVNGGQKVRKGQVIGAAGGTGNVTGPHLHFEIEGGAASPLGGTGTGGPILPPWAMKIIEAPKKWAEGLLGNKLKGGGLNGLAQGMLDKLIGPSASWAESQLGPAAYSGPMSGNVMRFVPTVKKVLGALGEKSGPTLMGAIMARMQKESGGNVGIVNTDDSNWAAGTPSVGLMQVIGPTYQANKPHPDKGPYKYGTSIDPYSNIYAGLHYARGRYGTIYNGMTQPGGYDRGGVAKGIGPMWKFTPERERVLSPHQTSNFDRMIDRNFRTNNEGMRDIRITSGYIDITEDGKAMIRGQAAAVIGSQVAHARTTRRQWV